VTTAAPVTRARIAIGGMDCADCAQTIERRLAETPGVASCDVQFGAGAVDIAYDPALVSPGTLKSRIRELGYSVGNHTQPDRPWLFTVTGMDCADCAATLSESVARVPGVQTADVNFATATLTVRGDPGQVTPARIVGAVERLGYRAVSAIDETGQPSRARRLSRRAVEIAAATGLALAGFALGMLWDRQTAAAIAHVAAALLAGYPVARAARVALAVRRADMNLLMTIAALGAIALQDWAEASTLMVLFAIGLALQAATIDRTRGAIRELMAIAPAVARVQRQSGTETVPVAEVVAGDLVDVLPGERLPIDGVVLAGNSMIDLSAITGESIPIAVGPASDVISGGINGDGRLTVMAKSSGTDTTVSRIIHLVEQAHASRAPAQALVERFAAIYTPVVIAAAIAIAAIGGLATSRETDWIYRGLVLLVVACPCALVISTPVAFVSALGRASRMGVLFKGGQALESLARVKQIAFDKTGTLTHGRPEVVSVHAFDGYSQEDILSLAAALERGATHPIGRGIASAAANLPLPDVRGIEVRPGLGVAGWIDSAAVQIGSAGLFAEAPDATTELLPGQSTVYVGRDGMVVGSITLADSIRPISAGVVASLRREGVEPVLLSGDSAAVALDIGARVGIDEVHGALLPEDKARIVAGLEQRSPVAMVGDGINDGPALAAATVGIAMGAGGSAVAIEAADVALMSDDLAQLPGSIRLARATRAVVLQNIAFALASKIAFLALTVGGYTSLWLAVAADVGASLVVTLNALRLMRGGT
jgi:Cd2+/Zn2+-exporting ATPase